MSYEQSTQVPVIKPTEAWKVEGGVDQNGHPEPYLALKGEEGLVHLEAVPEVLDTFPAPAENASPMQHRADIAARLGALAHVDLSKEPTVTGTGVTLPKLYAVFPRSSGSLIAAKLWQIEHTTDGGTVVRVRGQNDEVAVLPKDSPVEIFAAHEKRSSLRRSA